MSILKLIFLLQVLSDPEKKKIYDQFGEEGLKGGVPPGGAGGAGGFPGGYSYKFNAQNQEDLLKEMFGGANPFASFFGGMGGGGRGGSSFHFSSGGDDMFFGGGGDPFGGGGFPRQSGFGGASRKGAPVTREIYLDLEDLFNGVTKKFKIKRRKMNPDGRSQSEVEEVVTINVKPGWKSGTKVTFDNRGDEAPGVIPADVIFVIKEKPHPVFHREGNNLVYTANISLKDALAGCKVDVSTFDNRILRVNVKDVVHPSYVKVVKGEGMPISKAPGTRGDLKIKFNVQWPRQLSEHQKAAIAAAL